MRLLNYPFWLLLLFLSTLALGSDEFVISGILPDVAKDLDISLGQAGLLVTAFAFSFCIGAPILSVLGANGEKRIMLNGALLIFSMANFAMAWTASFEWAIVFRVLAGLAAAVISPLCMIIAANNAPQGEKGRYLSLATAGLTVALFTGVPLGALLAQLYSWRVSFLLIDVLGFMVAILIHFYCPTIAGGQRISLTVRLAPLKNMRLCRLILAMFFCGSGGLMFYSYLGAFITSLYGGGSNVVITTLLLVGIIGVVAVFGGGFLTDQQGAYRSRMLIIGGHCLALLLIYFYTIVFIFFNWGFFIAIAIWSLFAWALNPPMQASIINIAGDHAMLAMSLGISALYAGAAFGAAIGGYVIDHYTIASIPLIAAIFLGLAFILVSFNDRQLQ